MSSPQIHDLLVLKLVPGLGPRLTKALLDRFGSAEAVVRARPEQLADVPQIGAKLARRLYDAMRNVPVARELELVADHNVRLIAFESNEYPSLLKEIADPPHLLYLRGTLAKEDQRAIGIVGSRHCTAYGRRVAERLAAGLAHRGYTVISGLARGIDGAAHRGALAAGGRTIAVLAGGLRTIYPPEHRELACEVENHGALLSEAAMSMSPLAGMFPARNRLISGMSLAVVIVEAAEKSGALITARHAAEQGRVVFAIPGNIDSVASTGTNELIRRGAILARSADDIIEELEGVAANTTPKTESKPLPALDETEHRIWEFLAEPTHVDGIARALDTPVNELSATLMTMEMKKAIRRLPGNVFERC